MNEGGKCPHCTLLMKDSWSTYKYGSFGLFLLFATTSCSAARGLNMATWDFQDFHDEVRGEYVVWPLGSQFLINGMLKFNVMET